MQKIFTLRLSTKLFQKLEAIAAINQRSMSGQLRWLIASAESTQGDRTQDIGSENASVNKEETNDLLS